MALHWAILFHEQQTTEHSQCCHQAPLSMEGSAEQYTPSFIKHHHQLSITASSDMLLRPIAWSAFTETQTPRIQTLTLLLLLLQLLPLWLPVSDRVKFKLCCLINAIYYGRSPTYLTDIVHSVSTSRSCSGLCSSSTSLMDYSLPRLHTRFGDRAFFPCRSCYLEHTTWQYLHRGWSCQISKTVEISLFYHCIKYLTIILCALWHIFDFCNAPIFVIFVICTL